MKTDTDSLLESLMPEIRKAFSSTPEYGSTSFEVVFHDGRPVRIEYRVSLSRQLKAVAK